LYESTGLKGQSTLRKVDIQTGQFRQSRNLPDDLFGEGITILDGKVYQLTWKEQVGFVYDSDFNLLRKFSYPMEGWGLTHEEGATAKNRLIMSDGSSTLYFLDPQTLEVVDTLQVRTDNHDPVPLLNELEWIDGAIYANIWQTNYIAKIDPETGQVLSWIDLTGLLSSEEDKRADVLNGIAYDKVNGRYFVCGKLWPKLFEVEITSIQLIPQGRTSSVLNVAR
jgi:glutaminyl-peptide cyclotransferase